MSLPVKVLASVSIDEREIEQRLSLTFKAASDDDVRVGVGDDLGAVGTTSYIQVHDRLPR
jgi:hypothetical protein